MSLIIFLVILSALVIVHELGHFSVAKFFGIRVDEFGLGYPPKAKSLFRWKGTDFTLNWLPFGGFVKIFGENPSEEPANSISSPSLRGFPRDMNLPDSSSDNFQHKNRGIQALVLFAGVVGNFLFAWLLISLGFISGLPAPAGLNLPIENPETVITIVLPGSPAETAGLKSGDTIVSLSRGSFFVPTASAELTPEEASQFISQSFEPISFLVRRGEILSSKLVEPKAGLIGESPAVGVSMDIVGTVDLPFFQALFEGLKTSVELTVATAQALGGFILQALGGRADLSAVTGPVGLVGLVGDVSELGFGHLLIFTALISINLCLINLLPFPALDGGRLLFVGIEALTRKAIPPRIFNALNAAGFALLIFLMILITIHDVRNIF